MSTTQELQEALALIREPVVEALSGTGLEAKVVVLDLWCGLRPDGPDRVTPFVRTSRTSEGDTAHSFQFALTFGPDEDFRGSTPPSLR